MLFRSLVAVGAILVGATIFAMVFYRDHRSMLAREREKLESLIIDAKSMKRFKQHAKSSSLPVPRIFVISSSHSLSMESIPELNVLDLDANPHRYMGLRRHTILPTSNHLRMSERNSSVHEI